MIEIKKATMNDVCQIVDIHCEAFKGFFLTSLGRPFLLFYYSCFIRCSDGIVLCAFMNEKLIGFAASSIVCKGFNSKLIKDNFFEFFILAIKLVFISPMSLVRLCRNLTKKANKFEEEDYSELYSIGVDIDGQGCGVGSKLLIATEELLIKRGVNRISLTTDYNNNEKVISFYKKLGFVVLYDFITYPNRRMYRFIKNLE